MIRLLSIIVLKLDGISDLWRSSTLSLGHMMFSYESAQMYMTLLPRRRRPHTVPLGSVRKLLCPFDHNVHVVITD